MRPDLVVRIINTDADQIMARSDIWDVDSVEEIPRVVTLIFFCFVVHIVKPRLGVSVLVLTVVLALLANWNWLHPPLGTHVGTLGGGWHWSVRPLASARVILILELRVIVSEFQGTPGEAIFVEGRVGGTDAVAVSTSTMLHPEAETHLHHRPCRPSRHRLWFQGTSIST